MLPAGPAGADDPVLANALADLEEAPQLLAVDLQELARALALVAHASIACRSGKPRAACAAQHLPHGGGRALDDRGDHCRASTELGSPGEDLLLRLRGEPSGLPDRRRGAIHERSPAALPVATTQPVAGRAAGTAGGRGLAGSHRRRSGTRVDTSTRTRNASAWAGTLDHASGSPSRAGISTTPRLAGGPDVISRLAGVWLVQLIGLGRLLALYRSCAWPVTAPARPERPADDHYTLQLTLAVEATWASAGASGSETTNTAPPPTAPSTQIVPFCASTRPRQMASPSPMPRERRPRAASPR